MKAARLYGYGQDFVVEDVADPEPGPGEVLVRIGGSGVCHSDLHIRGGEMAALPFPPFPLTLGHENAGWVAALGEGAEGFEIGEPVAVYGGWGCGPSSGASGEPDPVDAAPLTDADSRHTVRSKRFWAGSFPDRPPSASESVGSGTSGLNS